MDYRIWAILEEKVYNGCNGFDSIDQLKTALNVTWEQISLNTVKQCIMGEKGFRARLKVVVARGGHIESHFRKC